MWTRNKVIWTRTGGAKMINEILIFTVAVICLLIVDQIMDLIWALKERNEELAHILASLKE